MTLIIIKHSRTFWEVRPPTKRNMQILLDYIVMHWPAWKQGGKNESAV